MRFFFFFTFYHSTVCHVFIYFYYYFFQTKLPDIKLRLSYRNIFGHYPSPINFEWLSY